MRGCKGVTLPEVVLSVAVLGPLSAISAKFLTDVTRFSVSQSAKASIQADAGSLFLRMSLNLSKAGAGVPNRPVATQRSLVARPDAAGNPDIIFFHKDKGTLGDLDPQDEWLRYRSVGGRILEEAFLADNWGGIKAGSVPASQTRLLPLSPGVQVDTLSFTLYSSQDPPQIVQDASAASYVKLRLVLRKGPVQSEHAQWVPLMNLIYGVSIP